MNKGEVTIEKIKAEIKRLEAQIHEDGIRLSTLKEIIRMDENTNDKKSEIYVLKNEIQKVLEMNINRKLSVNDILNEISKNTNDYSPKKKSVAIYLSQWTKLGQVSKDEKTKTYYKNFSK